MLDDDFTTSPTFLRQRKPNDTSDGQPALPGSSDPFARDMVADREFEFTSADFELVRRLIKERAGISLSTAKQNMVYSRLSRRLRARGFRRFADYLAFLSEPGADEWEAFTNALTTNLTAFFRESHHFPALVRHLRMLPPGSRPVIWCNAASTGEEPYTLAITACEAYNTMTPPVKIIASDIDTQVLATADRGIYPMERVEGLSPDRIKNYFHRGVGPNDGKVRVRPELRSLIEFRELNLLAPSWDIPTGLTAIFCRNVLIYFDRATQLQIVTRFAPLLAPNGLLFAGHSESLAHAARLFRLRGKTIYEKVAPATPTR